ncbi:phosphotransferase, partial [Saccharothrix sp. NRRL B-16348]|uniref:phosphotransferase n=1 Tax=Saccharothrix sp. NRRL B-16348 TaxID=1415542 RepID=UPI0018D17B37
MRRWLESEAEAARELAGRTRFRTPEPVALGEPGTGYPLPWSVQTWLPGVVAAEEDPGESVAFAYDLAEFIRGVRAVDTRGRTFNGKGRGGDLRSHDASPRRQVPTQTAQPTTNHPLHSAPGAASGARESRLGLPTQLGESRRDTGHHYYSEVAFTVLEVSESAELPTDSEFCPPTIQASNGKWITVRIKVVNEGNEPVVLATNANQSLYDGDRRYE